MHVNDENSHRDMRKVECLEAKSRDSIKETLNSIAGVHSKSRKGPCGFSSEKIVDELLLLQKHWEGLFSSGLYFHLGFKHSVIAVRIPRAISF